MKYKSSTYTKPDEIASLGMMVSTFSRQMEEKLLAKLKAGSTGWDDEGWTLDEIKQALIWHVEKGDFVDVANFAMFAWNRDDFPHIKLQRNLTKTLQVQAGGA